MKRKVYCCDATRDLYEEYYQRQNAGEIPVFVARRFQHGHGLGNILSGFFRRLVLPFFKAHGKKIMANAVKTSVDVADDVLEGKTVKESAKRRISTGIKRMLLGLGPQSGSGVRRLKRRKIGATFSRERCLLFTKVLANVRSRN